MAIIQDWKIRSTHAKCEVTGHPFADGEEFYTCIFEDPETDGFVRRDFSAPAWQETRGGMDPAPFSFWKSTYKAPVRTVEEKHGEDASIEGMLRRFVEEDDPATENARYILALMLERKRILHQADAREVGERVLLFYEHGDSGDVFIIADPGLKLDEIETIQREVADLLAAEEKRWQSGSEPVGDAAEEEAQADEDQTEKEGEQPAGSEEETVARAGEELPG